MPDDVLELETRRDLFELVRRTPGLHMREIQRQLDLSIALTEYHLRVLEEAGVVVSIAEEGYRRYYPATPSDGDAPGHGLGGQERRVVGLLRQALALRVTLFLLTRERATLTEMSAQLGASPSRLSFHIKKLVNHGVLLRFGRSQGRGYAIADRNRVLRLLVAYRPLPDLLDECAELWEGLGLG